ncbi:SPOR domain-containing protein [Leucothrix arctica]|uniref:SPOR domain-containing protein n=1 Tax=Leucothrix arctica TaxID=1481894 RepID=A0A317CK53_9GAMM|nr:SPOR domain-containing protein [Leucothrix arctica]PWQ96690.1 hypothetical protein DKT75_08820 [Leucothrix arctica]
MNKTTVKRGIGAVLLALLAAGLLAFLLKDKADQRQDIVDMPLPGSENTAQADGTTKLPQLSMDNTSSVNVDGSVIASAGAENTVKATGSILDSATGTIAASATAVGAGVAGAVSAVTNAGEKALDFNVRPPNTASTDFRDLSDVDLVNNGNSSAAVNAQSAVKATTTSAPKASTSTGTSRPSNTTKGSVIASSEARASGGQARLIDERKSAPPRSARTDKVVSSRKASTSSTSSKPAPVTTSVAAPAPVVNKAAPAAASSGSGYAIQLLATSSASRAQSLVSVMRKEGYSAYSTKVTQNGKLLYRVRIGQYANKAEASKVHLAMKRRYKQNADVNRSAIVRR